MADDGPLTRMLRGTVEGKFADFIDGYLYCHSVSETERLKFRDLEQFLWNIANEKLKATVPGWVKELYKLP